MTCKVFKRLLLRKRNKHIFGHLQLEINHPEILIYYLGLIISDCLVSNYGQKFGESQIHGFRGNMKKEIKAKKKKDRKIKRAYLY